MPADAVVAGTGPADGQAGAALRQLTKRAQFLKAARGKRAGRSAFTLQAGPCADEAAGIGYTVTKKTGNAPERNRIKRRLRAAARACANRFHPRHDYVLVGRREALSEAFDVLVADLGTAIAKVHANTADRPRNPRA
jgi:ribonuclease P protein component